MKKLITLFTLLLAAHFSFGQLIINEVLYDPSNNALDGDANGDGVYDQEDDSFIEFVNTGTRNFDASGYQIWDDTTKGVLRFVIPPNTLVPPNGALVVFGSSPLVGSFGNALVFSADTTPSHLNFNNSGEVIVIKDASGKTVLTFDSDALSNNPNESYTRFPDITGNFLQHGDTTSVLFSPGTRTDGTPFNTNLVVDAITVQGAGGATSISVDGATLQMEAVVTPSNAADTTVNWSLNPATGVGSISASGLLSPTGNGNVWVIATANDGAGARDSVQIAISNQTIGLSEELGRAFGVYPNPTSGLIQIETSLRIDEMHLYNSSGVLVMDEFINTQEINLTGLPEGIYLLKIVSEAGSISKRIIKQ
jgi:hypothetical protein